MTIHYQLNEEDILALQQDVIKHSYTHSVKKMYVKWFFAVVIFLAVWLLFKPSLTSAVVAAVLTAIYLPMFPTLYRKIVMARARRQLAKQDDASMFRPCDLTLSEEGIKRDQNGSVTYFNWEQFTRLGTDNHRYFLYQNDLQALILPKCPDDKNPDEVAAYQKQITSSVNRSASNMADAVTKD